MGKLMFCRKTKFQRKKHSPTQSSDLYTLVYIYIKIYDIYSKICISYTCVHIYIHIVRTFFANMCAIEIQNVIILCSSVTKASSRRLFDRDGYS